MPDDAFSPFPRCSWRGSTRQDWTAAPLDDLREAMTTLAGNDAARRVFGGAHPHTGAMENNLRSSGPSATRNATPSTRSGKDQNSRLGGTHPTRKGG